MTELQYEALLAHQELMAAKIKRGICAVVAVIASVLLLILQIEEVAEVFNGRNTIWIHMIVVCVLTVSTFESIFGDAKEKHNFVILDRKVLRVEEEL